MNVAWKLALICKGLSPPSLLETYTEERVPVIQEMLQITTGFFNKFYKQDKSMWSRPLALRQLGVHYRWSSIVIDELEDHENAVTSGTNIEPPDAYGNEGTDRLHAGDRAPDAPGLVVSDGTTTRLFDIYNAAQHTVLVFDSTLTHDTAAVLDNYESSVVRLIEVNEKSSRVEDNDDSKFTDSQGHARRAYGFNAGVKIAIIRPDGVVGGLVKSPSGVQKYFTKMFVSK
jgi:hypothetical protein